MVKSKKEEIKAVIANASNVYVASVDENGYPNIKAMFARMQEGIYHYMSTNLSNKRTQQFIKNNKCSLYYCDERSYKGVMLLGWIEVCTDQTTKSLLWRDSDIIYYSKGVDDPDYCVYRFVAEKGNYYYGLQNIDFDASELE